MASVQSKSNRPRQAGAVNGAAQPRRVRLTPAWAGRDLSLEEFENADYQGGWRFELIDGRVEVHPTPNPPHDIVVEWLRDRLCAYRDAHAEVINYVTSGCRIFIPGRRLATCPQPDLAGYQGFPVRWPRQLQSWQDI